MRLDGPGKNIVAVARFYFSPLSNRLSSFEGLPVGSKKRQVLDQATSADGCKVKQTFELIIGKVASLVLMQADAGVVPDLCSGTANKISVCIAWEDALSSSILIDDGTGTAAQSNQRIAYV